MAVPIPPERGFNFTSWTSTNPDTPQPGDKLDMEFDRSNASIAEVIDRLALVQRDDGALANGSVGVDQLQPAIINFGTALPLGGDGASWDASGFPIRSLEPGANPTDAVNKQQLDAVAAVVTTKQKMNVLLDALVIKGVFTAGEADGLRP